jgi:flagellar motor switch protein FliG
MTTDRLAIYDNPITKWLKPRSKTPQKKRSLSSLEKAAIVLNALGPKAVAPLMTSMSPEKQEKLRDLSRRVTEIPEETRDRIVSEFLASVGAKKPTRRRLPQAKPSPQPKRMDAGPAAEAPAQKPKGSIRPASIWDKLKYCTNDSLARILERESHQTAAYILSRLGSAKAVPVLEILPAKSAQRIVVLLARTPKVSEATNALIEAVIERDYTDELDYLSPRQRRIQQRGRVALKSVESKASQA